MHNDPGLLLQRRRGSSLARWSVSQSVWWRLGLYSNSTEARKQLLHLRITRVSTCSLPVAARCLIKLPLLHVPTYLRGACIAEEGTVRRCLCPPGFSNAECCSTTTALRQFSCCCRLLEAVLSSPFHPIHPFHPSSLFALTAVSALIARGTCRADRHVPSCP